MSETDFENVGKYYTKSTLCGVCGKTNPVGRYFSRPFDPDGRNPDGTLRTAQQVLDEVDVEAQEWLGIPALCYCRMEER